MNSSQLALGMILRDYLGESCGISEGRKLSRSEVSKIKTEIEREIGDSVVLDQTVDVVFIYSKDYGGDPHDKSELLVKFNKTHGKYDRFDRIVSWGLKAKEKNIKAITSVLKKNKILSEGGPGSGVSQLALGMILRDSESDLEEDSNAIKKLNKAYGSKLAIGSDPKNMIDNTWVGVSKSKRGVILEPFDRDATTKLYKSLKKNGIKAMISKKSHQILVLDEGAVIEGGPGSGVKYRNTAPIPMLQSPYVSVGTRKSMLQNMDYEEREVSLSQITHCCQKNYVPSKLEKFIKNPDWIADSPIDVLHVPGEGYHVVDGHHRYLAANALNMGTIPAKVYHKSEKSMPDYDADQGVAVELDGIHEEQAPMGCKCPQCMEKREFGEHPDQSPTFMRSYPEKAPDPRGDPLDIYSLADKFHRELKMKLGQLNRPVNASLSLGSPMGGNTSMG